jgi:uncharacterized protein YciI
MYYHSYYTVLFKKGPKWTDQQSIELDYLQQQHASHLDSMQQAGMLALFGPSDAISASDVLGIGIFEREAFNAFDELKSLVEADPIVKSGFLAAEYLTWYVPEGTRFG